ncbi:MAG: DNA-directed RNA polymerase subunit omega [bacterium]|nr:DNA-directed RNA polymerase subunit omega [bacterium]
MVKSKFRVMDELKEKYGSRYLVVLLASRIAKVIVDTRQEREVAARLGFSDEDTKPTVLALYRILREGVKYRLEQEKATEE